MKLRLLLLGLVLLVASACAPTIELRNPAYLQDTSLITQDPCAAPCWRGIIPGETRWSDALTQIEDDPTLADFRLESQGEDSAAIAGSFQRVDGIPCCLIYSENGQTVDQIFLQLAPDMTLGQVIETYGDPAYVSGTAEGEQGLIQLFYPEQQMVVYAFIENGAEGQVAETNEIVMTFYVRPQDMDLAVQRSNLYNWDGYKSYADYFVDQTIDKTAVPTEQWVTPEATPEATADN